VSTAMHVPLVSAGFVWQLERHRKARSPHAVVSASTRRVSSAFSRSFPYVSMEDRRRRAPAVGIAQIDPVCRSRRRGSPACCRCVPPVSTSRRRRIRAQAQLVGGARPRVRGGGLPLFARIGQCCDRVVEIAGDVVDRRSARLTVAGQIDRDQLGTLDIELPK
jgi:hypothetical protein